MELIVTIVFSASFGAIAGKLIDAFLLSKINDNIEKKKWLRQVKLEAFTQLSEELLSLGFKSGIPDHKWKLQGLTSKTILLLDNKDTISKINYFVENLSIVSSAALTDVIKTEPNTIESFIHFSGVTITLNELETKALEIVELLNKELKQ